MPTSREDLVSTALVQFALRGYAGTSLQHIADVAGLSKSSVLYHFTSKEALLEAALAPGVDALGGLLSRAGAVVATTDRAEFVEQFVDLLLEHRLAVHVFINQSRGLVDIPVIDRALAVIDDLSAVFDSAALSVEDKVRFGVALGGAAYLLVAGDHDHLTPSDLAELRNALATVVAELLSPIAPAPIAASPIDPAPIDPAPIDPAPMIQEF